jgi:hypothetical protein
MKIEIQVARVPGRAKTDQALVICAADDEMPAGHDAVAVRVPRGLADRAAEDDLREAMHMILRLADEREDRLLVMPALGSGRDRSRNDVAAAIIVGALLEDGPRLAPRLERVIICLSSWGLGFGFAKAQQLHDPGDQRPRTVDAAVQHLIDTLPGRALAELAALAETDLIRTHMGLALYLRNGLLHRNYALRDNTGDRDRDGASGIVVKALWRELKRNQKGAVYRS